MKLEFTVHVNLTGDVFTTLLAQAAAILSGVHTMQEQVNQLTALVASLKADVAASVANSDKLAAAVGAARGQISALSAQVAQLQAAGTMPDLQPVLDELAAADQTLADATLRNAAPADAPAA